MKLAEISMAGATASRGAASSRSALRRAAVPKWVVVGVISAYCAGLAAGLLIYRRISAAPVQRTAAGISKNQQIGRILVVTPNGCKAGQFDNTSPTFTLSQASCDEGLEKIDRDAGSGRSGDARIRAIGRYFRGEN